ncbi:DUF1549 and DUF1553 domain-containing protein [bacterium]|nr:DUF1549 and DUF1553 domain-containing protein [bacterium]
MRLILLFLLVSWPAISIAAPKQTPHWSYVKPQRPSFPETRSANWVQNEIDYFVLHRLESEGLSPSPQADKTTLIRRVTLDLTGLPPTLQEIDAFMADDSQGAYSRLIDQLLESPQYAERMTAWWLDMARYADTSGYESDPARSIWLYRDWVIDAFRRGLPFDQFTVQQLAGDLLPNPTVDQRLATGFHRNAPFCYEAGTDLEQFRVESVVDRVNTTMTVWMGTTMGCAQCHDHKYDPFTQREYFQLYAFFNSSAETDPNVGTLSAISPLNRGMVGLEERIAEIEKTLEADTPELIAAQVAWEASFARENQWQVLAPRKYESLAGATLDRLDDDSILVSGENSAHDTYELTIQWDGNSSDLTAIGMEVLKHESLPSGGPGRYDSNGNFALSNLQIEYALPNNPGKWQSVTFAKAYASYEEANDKVAGTIDDDPVTNWCTNNNAAHAVFIADKPYRLTDGCIVRIRMRHDSKWEHHGVGRFRLWVSSGNTDKLDRGELAPLLVLAALSIPNELRTSEQSSRISDYYRSISPLLAPARREIVNLRNQLSTSQTLIMVEREEPRETRLLNRGSFLDPGDLVEPEIPAAWHDWPEGAPRNRLGLAQWLMHSDNPLVGRVTMNRIWAMFFGKGIVKTSEDFGVQASQPTHPKLLDYLATQFVAGGWNIRAMQKQIVTSASYRQSSRVTRGLVQHDPNNELFARGPAFRLDAEMIRDNALAISGLLTRRLGGPGVYPFQPAGVFDQIHSFTTKWEESVDGNQFRRALYTWWKRTAPYPSLLTFDAPRRNVCVERRSRTNTPLQALVTLNDPVFFQCATALGRRMATEIKGNARQRVTYGFRVSVARPPTSSEVDQLVELYTANLKIFQNDLGAALSVASNDLPGDLPKDVSVAELAAWAIVGNVLLNLDETLTKY